jgi:hypothetical protein
MGQKIAGATERRKKKDNAPFEAQGKETRRTLRRAEKREEI